MIANYTARSTTQYPEDALANRADLDAINMADAHTLDEVFRERVRRSPNKEAYRQYNKKNREWVSQTWSQMAAQVERWQVAFRESGLKKGDRVAVCYRNSIEWVVFDQAALRLGLVVVPIYALDRADNIAYILADSGAKLVLLSDAGVWESVLACNDLVNSIEIILVLADEKANKTNDHANEHNENDNTDLEVQLVSNWLPEDGLHLERGVAQAGDLASIVYTSGTTGRPKGVMLTHRNMLSNAYNGLRSVALSPSDTLLSFLPLSHTLERSIGYYSAIVAGSCVVFNRSIMQLSDDLAVVKPTVMIAVPRIFEQVHNKLLASLGTMSGVKRFLFKSTINVGWHKFNYQQGSNSWHPKLLFAPLLDRLVAQPVRQKIGGRLKYAIVGGAPMGVDVSRVFISLNIPLLQGYGLTESSPVVSVNTLKQNKPNSIGLPLRGVEAKLADGTNELLVKGDNVMQGYWNNVQATEQAIDVSDDGRWLKTGDCASIDDDGFIRIVGRIKDILVMSNGEKVPPTDIEAAIARHTLFNQVLVLGEGLSFLAALVVVDNKALIDLCERNGWDQNDLSAKALQAYALKEIASQMSEFPSYAKIRKVVLLDKEWTVEDDLLTSTLKLRRRQIIARYQAEIDAIYLERGAVKL